MEIAMLARSAFPQFCLHQQRSCVETIELQFAETAISCLVDNGIHRCAIVILDQFGCQDHQSRIDIQCIPDRVGAVDDKLPYLNGFELFLRPRPSQTRNEFLLYFGERADGVRPYFNICNTAPPTALRIEISSPLPGNLRHLGHHHRRRRQPFFRFGQVAGEEDRVVGADLGERTLT
jgi:hypothetical protein